MADVLLIQPPVRDFYLTAGRTIPHGLLCLASCLRAAGFGVELVDALASSHRRIRPWPAEFAYLTAHYGRADCSPFALFHEYRHFGLGFEHLGRVAKASGAFLVGISSLCSAYAEEALATAAAVKAQHPHCHVVLGGHHPTALPAQVMASPAVDFVLRGEGEHSLVQLAKALRDGGSLDGIAGLVRRADGGLRVAAPAFVEDLDDLPLPASELLVRRPYRQRAVVVTSRGCTLRCSYCATSASASVPYRRRNLAAVLAEIAHEVQSHGARLIDFEDENLSLERRWFLALLEGIRGLAQPALELRAMNGLLPHTLDHEVIAAMKAAGFRTLNLSLGSASPEQLRRFRRPDEREAFTRALDAAEAQGLQAVGYIIVGAPEQDPRASLADLLWLGGQRVLVGVSIFYPAPGSEDYARCEILGLLPPSLAQLRATALPLCHTTTRLETITLWRLGRVLNFAKRLVDEEGGLPPPAPLEHLPQLADRTAVGRALLQALLHDGLLRGVSPSGEVYLPPAATPLVEAFAAGLQRMHLRGWQSSS